MDWNAECTGSFAYARRCVAQVLGWMLVLVVPVQASAASLAVVVASTEVRVGEQFRVDLQISGLGDLTEPSLGTFDLTSASDLGFSIQRQFTSATGSMCLGLAAPRSSFPACEIGVSGIADETAKRRHNFIGQKDTGHVP